MRSKSKFIRRETRFFADFSYLCAKQKAKMMKTSVILRFVVLGCLWLALAAYILLHAKINFFTIFAIAASGIIVFVPLYKKYVDK